MEKKLSFGVMLSLKEISLRRMTVILWSQTDILDSFDRCSCEVDKVEDNIRKHQDERCVEDKVKDKISKLPLPPLLTEQMNHLVKPIESEIRNWKRFHKKMLNLYHGRIDVHILQNLCWTVLGSIDYRRTAENIICSEMLHIHERYKLACLYCLDDYIPTLWEKIPEWRKEGFYLKYYDPYSPLEIAWPLILKGNTSELDSRIVKKIGNLATFNQDAFENSAKKGNKAATEYYFRKLTNVEREASLFKTAEAAIMYRSRHEYLLEDFPEEKLSETICYLLSLMSLEQQMEICKEYTAHILRCLLDWPLQNMFWVFAECFWSFLETNHYVTLLNIICNKGRSCHLHKRMFKKFFQRGSSSDRKYFLDYSLRKFFDYPVFETFQFILRNVDYADRKTLIFTRDTFEFFFQLISTGGWYLVEFCLQEATFSKEDKEELKEGFRGFLSEMEISNVNTRDNILKLFFHFLD